MKERWSFWTRPISHTGLKRSTFGPAGDTAGQWECPDLIELPVEGTNEKKWVLIINRNPGAPAGGTGVRYLIGKFDGTTFTSEVPDAPALWADWGKDFYATNTWKNMPEGDGRESVESGWLQQLEVCECRADRAMARSAIHPANAGGAPLCRRPANGPASSARVGGPGTSMKVRHGESQHTRGKPETSEQWNKGRGLRVRN